MVALSDSFVVSMSPVTFKDIVTTHPWIAWTLLKDLTHLVRQLSDRVIEFTALGVVDRLHVELLRLAREGLRDDGTAVITPFPTNDELASRISTRREAVNRELRHLENNGADRARFRQAGDNGCRASGRDGARRSWLVGRRIGRNLCTKGKVPARPIDGGYRDVGKGREQDAEALATGT